MTLRTNSAILASLLFFSAAALSEAADPSPVPLGDSGQKAKAEQDEAIAALKENRFVPQLDKDGNVVALNMSLLFTRRGGIDQDLVHVAKLTSLRNLEFGRAKVTDAGLEKLKTLSHLRSLLLPPGITDDGLRRLAVFRELEELAFDPDSRVGDEGMKHLTRLPKLSRLRLHGRIGDEGAAVLGKIETLKKLDFHDTASLTEAGIAHLEGLENLQELGIDRFKLTDRALQSLAKLKQLRVIRLRFATGASVNDGHIDGLARLTQLKELDLNSFSPTLTAKGLSRLREALPKTNILCLTIAKDDPEKP